MFLSYVGFLFYCSSYICVDVVHRILGFPISAINILNTGSPRKSFWLCLADLGILTVLTNWSISVSVWYSNLDTRIFVLWLSWQKEESELLLQIIECCDQVESFCGSMYIIEFFINSCILHKCSLSGVNSAWHVCRCLLDNV